MATATATESVNGIEIASETEIETGRDQGGMIDIGTMTETAIETGIGSVTGIDDVTTRTVDDGMTRHRGGDQRTHPLELARPSSDLFRTNLP